MRALLEHPGAALAHTAILQYRPVNTDILPMFVIYHIFVRAASVAAAAGAERDPWRLAVALCARVRVRLDHPGLAEPVWFFNPLAWQLLIVLGAWWIIGGKRLRPWVTSRTLMVLAVLYLAFSLIITLSWSIKSVEPLVPQTLTNLLFPVDKSNLSPLRLLHFLALAILAARFVPHTWRGLMTPVMRGAMRCGEN